MKTNLAIPKVMQEVLWSYFFDNQNYLQFTFYYKVYQVLSTAQYCIPFVFIVYMVSDVDTQHYVTVLQPYYI